MDTLVEVDIAFPWFFPAVVFVFGAAIGSFLNVCILRIPEGRSIVRPGSTCACGQPIAWYDNIPILSWLVLRGRARCCGQRFSVRYPAIELLTAALFLLCWWRLPPAGGLAGMLLVAILICATFIDLDHMEIPNRFTIGAAVVGVVLSGVFPAIQGEAVASYPVASIRAVVTSVTGLLVGSGVILWIGLLGEIVLRKEAMGFGDVKFLGAIGAFLGWRGALFSIFGGAIVGTLAFAVVLLVHGLTRRKKDGGSAEAPLAFGRETPFGPMLAAGAVLYLLWLRPLVDGYFDSVAPLFASNPF